MILFLPYLLFLLITTNSQTITTQYGPITGYQTSQGYSFTNIPFAASTEGSNRFAAPEPPLSWSTPLSCVDDPPMCPQICNLPDYYCSQICSLRDLIFLVFFDISSIF